jgi:hypothetical protein
MHGSELHEHFNKLFASKYGLTITQTSLAVAHIAASIHPKDRHSNRRSLAATASLAIGSLDTELMRRRHLLLTAAIAVLWVTEIEEGLKP